MSERREADGQGTTGGSTLKRVAIYAGVLGLVFLLGLVPMWWKAREATSERDAVRKEFTLARLENLIGGAALDAGRGEYEAARQQTSEFFTRLRAEADLHDRSAIAPQRLEQVENLFAYRDDIITLLARNDPSSASRLADVYFTYTRAVRGAR